MQRILLLAWMRGMSGWLSCALCLMVSRVTFAVYGWQCLCDRLTVLGLSSLSR
jgi:hypothetical protein